MADAKAKVFPNPVDWDELYPGRFLKAADLKGKKVTVEIGGVKLEELVGDKGPQVKGIMSFRGRDKQLPLNKTNGILVKAMFGRSIGDWVGKRIVLFEDTWNSEPCIRVWGSPDIPADIEVQVALPRKRPFTKTMRRTGTQSSQPPTTQSQPARTRSIADADAEPPDEVFETAGGSDDNGEPGKDW